jgi:hypothetical protein
VQVLAACCVPKQSSYNCQPGHHARTCPLNRQGTAAAAHPHACLSKGCSSTASCTPLQHMWGSKAHTQACTRMHQSSRALAHTHTHAHVHTNTNTNAREYSQARTHTHIHVHALTHRHACTHTHTHTHTRTCTSVHTHTHTHTCICTHRLCA